VIPYHPASNGLAERAVQTVKQGFKRIKDGTLTDKIARFLFSYRTTPQSTTGVTPAELLMNQKLQSRLDLLKPDLAQRVTANKRNISLLMTIMPQLIYSKRRMKYMSRISEGMGPSVCQGKLHSAPDWYQFKNYLEGL